MKERQGYGQFCPIARASEILATRWTPLILRELHFGSTRYGDLRRGLPRISSAMLAQRLKELEQAGIVTVARAEGAGPAYGLSEAGAALFPVLEAMGRWAQAHARADMTKDDNLDPDLLMWNIRRRANCGHVPAGGHFVAMFQFLGVPVPRSRFWLLFTGDGVEICLRDPGHEVGLQVTAHIRTMTRIWLGHLPLDQAISSRDLLLEGSRQTIREFSDWFALSALADSCDADGPRS
ncbi:winged helix-turn-helix transcriptional regulator [Frigidibacter sp. MR17.24]|uniref:winged helix-turn-helix transcriptional regulator n=1 Tax=Frigidibacter sp. MR17.24 TaxID=3127345 RepID=UPI003012EE02